MLALQEVASGRLALDTPAVGYWRDFPDPSGGAITVRHLLTHRSGLKHWGGVEGFLDGRARLRHDPAEVVGLYAAQGLAFPPGTAEDYSSIGYMVVGILLEKVSIETRQRWSTGGILSTVDDLLRWDLALNTAKLLPDSLRALVCERTDGEAA